MDADDYIKKCGGLTQKSGNSKIIVIHQNGESVDADDAGKLQPGDEIMVLPKYESKNIEVTRYFDHSLPACRCRQSCADNLISSADAFPACRGKRNKQR
jgi:hypothetical protein